MAATRSAPVSARTVVGLVAAIVMADVVGNVLPPEEARVPIKLALLVVLVAWARRSVGLSWDELGFARAHLRAGLRLGGAAAALITTVIALAVVAPGTGSGFANNEIANASTVRQVLTALVLIPLGTALFEETIFRGVLLGVLLRRQTRVAAIVTSSVLFGLWHVGPALSDANGASGAATLGIVVGTVVVTAAAGVGFAWLRLRSESLAAPVIAHFALNSVAYIGAALALHR